MKHLRDGDKTWVTNKKTIYVDTKCRKGSKLKDTTLAIDEVTCKKCLNSKG